MQCTVCGSQLPEGAKFCTTCGNTVQAAAVSPESQSEHLVDSTVLMPHAYVQRQAQEQPLPYYQVESTAQMSHTQQQAIYEKYKPSEAQSKAHDARADAQGQYQSAQQLGCGNSYQQADGGGPYQQAGVAHPYPQQDSGSVQQQAGQTQQAASWGVGRIIAFVAIALAVAGATALGVYAFLSRLGPFAGLASPSSSAQTSAASEVASREMTVPDEYMGTWIVVSMSEGTTTISHDEMAMYNEKGRFIFIVIERDGTLKQVMEDKANASRSQTRTGVIDVENRTATIDGKAFSVELVSDGTTLVLTGNDSSMTCWRINGDVATDTSESAASSSATEVPSSGSTSASASSASSEPSAPASGTEAPSDSSASADEAPSDSGARASDAEAEASDATAEESGSKADAGSASATAASSSSAASSKASPKKTTLTVAYSPDYPPFMFEYEGRIDGFDVDLMLMIGEIIGMDIQFVKCNWDEIIPSIQSGKYDAAICGITVTSERSKDVAFSVPYYTYERTGEQFAIIVAKDNTELRNDIDDAIVMLQEAGMIASLDESYQLTETLDDNYGY